MYTVYWNRYPHGIEGEEMITKSRDFKSFEKTRRFLENRLYAIRSINWAGGHIEDDAGEWLFDITDSGEIYDNR